MRTRISKFIATGGGIGYLPYAPGTFGSIEAVLLTALLYPGKAAVQVGCCLLSFVVGVWAAREAARETGHPDPPVVVVDEICGIFVTFLFIPINATNLFIGFVLFRLFDIFKLPWIRRLEALPNGYGIMLDDVAAGILSNLVLRGLLLLLS